MDSNTSKLELLDCAILALLTLAGQSYNVSGLHALLGQQSTVPLDKDSLKQLQAAERLQTLVRPFVLRRLKQTVLTELPEKTEITLHVQLSQAERHHYEAIRRNALEALQEPPAAPA